MNRNDFVNMIGDSVQFNRQILGEVYELIDIFPYFQSAHMLLLKGLQSNDDVKFENQLRNSAIHIADREVLYYLLKTKSIKEADQTKIKQETLSIKERVSGSEQTVIESALNSDLLIKEFENDSEALNSNDNISSSPKVEVHSILISAESDNTDFVSAILLMDEDNDMKEEPIFYMDPGFSVPEQSDLLELDLDENNLTLSDEDSIDFELDDSDNKEVQKKMQSELIEKFIIANPRIEPIRDKTNSTDEDIPKPFGEETGGFVTETLARIYINQEYYSKAIDIYEKLSLKFPEKSSYFASQIEKVKAYIKK